MESQLKEISAKLMEHDRRFDSLRDELREEIRAVDKSLRGEMRASFRDFRQEMNLRFDEVLRYFDVAGERFQSTVQFVAEKVSSNTDRISKLEFHTERIDDTLRLLETRTIMLEKKRR